MNIKTSRLQLKSAAGSYCRFSGECWHPSAPVKNQMRSFVCIVSSLVARSGRAAASERIGSFRSHLENKRLSDVISRRRLFWNSSEQRGAFSRPMFKSPGAANQLSGDAHKPYGLTSRKTTNHIRDCAVCPAFKIKYTISANPLLGGRICVRLDSIVSAASQTVTKQLTVLPPSLVYSSSCGEQVRPLCFLIIV